MTRSPDAVDVFVGRNLVAARTRAGLSQAALATRLGISFQQLQKYESGANRISASRLHHAAAALKTPVQAFFPDLDAPPPPSAPLLDGEARSVALAFQGVRDRKLRRAVRTVVEALAGAA